MEISVEGIFSSNTTSRQLRETHSLIEINNDHLPHLSPIPGLRCGRYILLQSHRISIIDGKLIFFGKHEGIVSHTQLI